MPWPEVPASLGGEPRQLDRKNDEDDENDYYYDQYCDDVRERTSSIASKPRDGDGRCAEQGQQAYKCRVDPGQTTLQHPIHQDTVRTPGLLNVFPIPERMFCLTYYDGPVDEPDGVNAPAGCRRDELSEARNVFTRGDANLRESEGTSG